MLEIQAGYAFLNNKAYLGVSTGVNQRSNDFSDEFRYGLEVGYRIHRFTTILKADGIYTFFNGKAPISDNGIFSNNTEYLIITPEIRYNIKDSFGLTANTGFVLFGRNILAAPNYSVGLFYKLNKNK